MKISLKLAYVFAFITMSMTSHLSASSIVLPPTTIDEYLSTSEVIVLGRIGPIEKKHLFYGYQDNAAGLERLDALTPIQWGLEYVDYEIVVDEVISSAEGHYRGEPGERLILRVMRGHDQEKLDRLAITEDRGQFLMFLNRQPDGTYGFYSFGHKVNVDADRPVWFFAGATYDVLDGARGSQELIFEVREKVARP